MTGWELVAVAAVALAASALTLFSGFGLGTLLLPVFAYLFPLETAVAATAVVHLANNAWKVVLVGRGVLWPVVGRFGVPALVAAFAGAWLLLRLGGAGEAGTYALGGTRTVTWTGLILGAAIVAFAAWDLVPRLKRWTVPARWLPAGGALSGFFGGLSGHQGALRSAFLAKATPDARTFVATGVWCAILVDVARLVVYGPDRLSPGGAGVAVAVACAAALVGALVGKRLLGKTTLDGVRTLVGAIMVATGALMMAGLV